MLDRLFVALAVTFGLLALALTAAPIGGLNVTCALIAAASLGALYAHHRLGRRHP
jgi:hypothetical protein